MASWMLAFSYYVTGWCFFNAWLAASCPFLRELSTTIVVTVAFPFSWRRLWSFRCAPLLFDQQKKQPTIMSEQLGNCVNCEIDFTDRRIQKHNLNEHCGLNKKQ